MPRKTFHPSNPTDQSRWEAMSDHEDFYVVLPGHFIGVNGPTRAFKLPDGRSAQETLPGEPINAGSIVAAKAFGPGADLQRHVDNGAIAEADPWQVEAIRSKFAPDAGRTTALQGKATTVADAEGSLVNPTGTGFSQAPKVADDRPQGNAGGGGNRGTK